MSRTPRQPPIPSALVPALLRFVGTEAVALIDRFALPADAMERDEVDVTATAIDEIIEVASGLVGDPALALRLPAELPFRRYALGELAARAAPTVRASLEALAPHVMPQLHCELAGCDWRVATPAYPRGIGRHVHEYALAYVVSHLRTVTGGAVPIVRVWFAHPRPRALAAIERWFATDDIEFGSADSGFTVAPELLDRVLVTADPRLAATIAELIPDAPRGDDLASRVGAVVRGRLPEPTSADDAAALLHMSARTLQRRLEAEGTSFTAVVDVTRESLARELLADDAIPLAEVGYRLGFADVATFSRAFKRWTGTSPGRFRGA